MEDSNQNDKNAKKPDGKEVKASEKSESEKALDALTKKIRKEVEDEIKKESKDPELIEIGKFAKKVLATIKDLNSKPETAIDKKSASDLMPVSRDELKAEFAQKLGIETKGKAKKSTTTQKDAVVAAAKIYIAYGKLAPVPKPKPVKEVAATV